MSYSNKRQKKRSAQLRKKYHDSREREKEGETSKQPQRQQNKSKPAVKGDIGRLHTTSNSGKSASIRDEASADTRPDDRVPPDSRPDDGEVKPDHRKYARRKLVSNWDRYEDDDGEEVGQEEEEEELQRRLVQLLNLPTALPSETLFTEDAEQSHADKSSFLSLDCNALAEALSSLPLHKRLDISLELLELGTDSSHSSTENEVENLDLTGACSSKSSDKTVKQHHQQFTFQLTREPSLHKSGDILLGARERARGATVVAQGTDRDEELDKLLKADTHSQRASSGTREVTSRVTTHDSQLDTPTHSDTTSLVGTAGDLLATDPNSAELDDILDELLA